MRPVQRPVIQGEERGRNFEDLAWKLAKKVRFNDFNGASKKLGKRDEYPGEGGEKVKSEKGLSLVRTQWQESCSEIEENSFYKRGSRKKTEVGRTLQYIIA